MFKFGGCCGCCGKGWDFAQNFGEHARFSRNSAFQVGVQPPIEGFYSITGGGSVTPYSSIPGLGVAPYNQFGACSNGNVLVYDVNRDIYEMEPFPPFRSLGVKWDRTTALANTITDISFRHNFAWYHTEWGYGVIDCVTGINNASRKGFNSSGTLISPTVQSGQVLNGTVCMDKDGNIYYVTQQTANPFTWRVFRSGSQIYSNNSVRPGKLVHSGDNLYAGGDDGLYLLSGGTLTRVYTSETELAVRTNILPYMYTEVLNRMNCAFGHRTPGLFGAYRENPHRINFRGGKPFDDYMMFGAAATIGGGLVVEWS